MKIDLNRKQRHQVVEILRDAGCNVLGIVSIFTYGMNKGLENWEAND